VPGVRVRRRHGVQGRHVYLRALRGCVQAHRPVSSDGSTRVLRVRRGNRVPMSRVPHRYLSGSRRVAVPTSHHGTGSNGRAPGSRPQSLRTAFPTRGPRGGPMRGAATTTSLAISNAIGPRSSATSMVVSCIYAGPASPTCFYVRRRANTTTTPVERSQASCVLCRTARHGSRSRANAAISRCVASMEVPRPARAALESGRVHGTSWFMLQALHHRWMLSSATCRCRNGERDEEPSSTTYVRRRSLMLNGALMRSPALGRRTTALT
jgi:hypothetical protein